MIEKNSIKVDRTANYYTIGETRKDIEDIWLVIHGYGQLAAFFILKFEVLSRNNNIIVAPEGLSRYYLHNDSGRVGASWMTKQSREEEIADQIAYLNNLTEKLRAECANEVRLNVLAFSQGVATAYRWFANTDFNFNKLIFWSGSLPDEKIQRKTDETTVYFLYGDKDEYLHLMKKERQLEILKENFKRFDYHVFSGKHEINRELLLELNSKYKWA